MYLINGVLPLSIEFKTEYVSPKLPLPNLNKLTSILYQLRKGLKSYHNSPSINSLAGKWSINFGNKVNSFPYRVYMGQVKALIIITKQVRIQLFLDILSYQMNSNNNECHHTSHPSTKSDPQVLCYYKVERMPALALPLLALLSLSFFY